MKFLLFLCCLLFLMPNRSASAADYVFSELTTEPETVLEENTQHQQSEMGTAEILFLADAIFTYKDSIQVRFKETETDEIFCISTEGFKEDIQRVPMPRGTWELYSVQFENKAFYGALPYLAGEDTFTIQAGEVTEVTVVVENHQVNPQAMAVDLAVENNTKFSGTVQMWLEGEADCYYTDEEQLTNKEYVGKHLQENYTLRYDPDSGYTLPIDAGSYQVVKAYAYDENGNAMDLCYEPEIKIGRYSENPEITVKIFDAGEADGYGAKYALQKAADTPEFAYNYYYREVKSLRKALGVAEKDPFEGIDTEENQKRGEAEEKAYQDYIAKYGDGHETVKAAPKKEEVEKEGNGFLPIIIMVAGIAVIGGIWYWVRKKREKKKK